MAGPHRPLSAATRRRRVESYGGPKGSEQGDVMSSLLQNSDPRVPDRLEMMDWPRGTVAWLREGWKKVDDGRG